MSCELQCMTRAAMRDGKEERVHRSAVHRAALSGVVRRGRGRMCLSGRVGRKLLDAFVRSSELLIPTPLTRPCASHPLTSCAH